MVDLLSLLTETPIQQSLTMFMFTLAVFSWSLFQFTINLALTTQSDSYESLILEDSEELIMPSKKTCGVFRRFCHFSGFGSDLWSIIITLVFMDGPFLVLRLTGTILKIKIWYFNCGRKKNGN